MDKKHYVDPGFAVEQFKISDIITTTSDWEDTGGGGGVVLPDDDF